MHPTELLQALLASSTIVKCTEGSAKGRWSRHELQCHVLQPRLCHQLSDVSENSRPNMSRNRPPAETNEAMSAENSFNENARVLTQTRNHRGRWCDDTETAQAEGPRKGPRRSRDPSWVIHEIQDRRLVGIVMRGTIVRWSQEVKEGTKLMKTTTLSSD